MCKPISGRDSVQVLEVDKNGVKTVSKKIKLDTKPQVSEITLYRDGEVIKANKVSYLIENDDEKASKEVFLEVNYSLSK